MSIKILEAIRLCIGSQCSSARMNSMNLKRRYRNIRNERMNEYHFPIVCGRCDNGGLVFMYEFMHVCNNVCTSLYIGMHACMCVRLANDFINVKTETK